MAFIAISRRKLVYTGRNSGWKQKVKWGRIILYTQLRKTVDSYFIQMDSDSLGPGRFIWFKNNPVKAHLYTLDDLEEMIAWILFWRSNLPRGESSKFCFSSFGTWKFTLLLSRNSTISSVTNNRNKNNHGYSKKINPICIIIKENNIWKCFWSVYWNSMKEENCQIKDKIKTKWFALCWAICIQGIFAFFRFFSSFKITDKQMS